MIDDPSLELSSELSGSPLEDLSSLPQQMAAAKSSTAASSTFVDDVVLNALDFAHLPMLVLCPKGCIRVVNTAALSVLKVPQSVAVLGRYFDDFLRDYFQFVTSDFRSRLCRSPGFSVCLPDNVGHESWRICIGELVDERRYVVLQQGGHLEGSHSGSRTERCELDALTGLGNQKLFERLVDDVEQGVLSNPRAVLLLDFDQFQEINGSYGHGVGDRVIQLAAARLRRAIRPSDPILRLNGDEFVVLLEGKLTVESLLRLGHRVVDLMSRTFLADGLQVDVSMSAGLALSQTKTWRWLDLTQRAEEALLEAKQAGVGGLRLYGVESEASAAH